MSNREYVCRLFTVSCPKRGCSCEMNISAETINDNSLYSWGMAWTCDECETRFIIEIKREFTLTEHRIIPND